MVQDIDERRRETPVSIFHPTLLILSAGVSNAFLAGDLFNLYVGFEILLFASLRADHPRRHRRTGPGGDDVRRRRVLSSMLFLVAIASIYAATGTVNLAQLSIRLGQLAPDTQLVLHLLLLTVFAIKAAIFPLSAWLPDSYPTAPAPVTAVFAGLLTKVGVYAIIRTQTLLFPDQSADRPADVGRAGDDDRRHPRCRRAVRHQADALVHAGQPHRLHGVRDRAGRDHGLATPGRSSTRSHHITIQTTLFLVVGLIELRGGSTSLNRLGGLAAIAPVLARPVLHPGDEPGRDPAALGLRRQGRPAAGGCRSSAPRWRTSWWPAAVVTSLLTLYAIAKVWNRAFWRGGPATDQRGRVSVGSPLPFGMVATTAVLVALGIGITVIAGPLYAYTQRAAVDLKSETAYVHAVLPPGVRQ